MFTRHEEGEGVECGYAYHSHRSRARGIFVNTFKDL